MPHDTPAATLGEERLKEIEARANAATPETIPYLSPPGGAPAGVCDYAVVSTRNGMETARVWNETDARFYGHARADALELIASHRCLALEVERLTKERDAARGKLNKALDLTDQDLETAAQWKARASALAERVAALESALQRIFTVANRAGNGGRYDTKLALEAVLLAIAQQADKALNTATLSQPQPPQPGEGVGVNRAQVMREAREAAVLRAAGLTSTEGDGDDR